MRLSIRICTGWSVMLDQVSGCPGFQSFSFWCSPPRFSDPLVSPDSDRKRDSYCILIFKLLSGNLRNFISHSRLSRHLGAAVWYERSLGSATNWIVRPKIIQLQDRPLTKGQVESYSATSATLDASRAYNVRRRWAPSPAVPVDDHALIYPWMKSTYPVLDLAVCHLLIMGRPHFHLINTSGRAGIIVN